MPTGQCFFVLKGLSLFLFFNLTEVDQSLNNVLILDFEGKLSQWDRIRSSLFGPDLFPVNVFDVHLDFVHKQGSNFIMKTSPVLF